MSNKDNKAKKNSSHNITHGFNRTVYRQPNKLVNAASGRTLLIDAILNNDSIKVQSLLGAGANPGRADKKRVSPLHHAALLGNTAIIDMLVNAGAQMNACNKNSQTPLFDALKAPNPLEVITGLLKNGANPDLADNNNSLPLHIAAETADYKIVELLINTTHDIDLPDNSGTTPLHCACKENSLEVIKTFIARGASPFKHDKDYNTLLHSVIERQDEQIIQHLLSTKAATLVNAVNLKKETPLHLAVKQKNINVIKMLINTGADCNILDDNKLSPLHIAAMENSYEIFSLLVENGANIADQNNKAATTPLIIAVSRNNERMIKTLINHGADVNASAGNGDFPLLMAAYKANSATLKLLLKIGANPNQKSSSNGKTALHISCQHGREEAIKTLLEHNPDVNVADKSGFTPLHAIVNDYVNSPYYDQKKKIDIINLMLEKGADPLINDNIKECPYDIAHIYNEPTLTNIFNKHLSKKGIKYKSTKSQYGRYGRYGRGFDYY